MTKKIVLLLLMIPFILVLVLFLIQYKKPAPPGIDGLYILVNYDPIYSTFLKKDTFLYNMQKEGLIISSDIIHEYDPPWDSLSYIINNIECDTQKIQAYIKFNKGSQEGYTTFHILWMEALPSTSYDTVEYHKQARKYYNCFEDILIKQNVEFKGIR